MADPCQSYKEAVTNARRILDRIIDDPDHDPNEYKRARRALTEAENALSSCMINNPLSPPMTNVGQAMVTVEDYTYVFAVDLEGRILYSKWKLGGSAPGWREVGGGGRTNTAPAAAVIQSAKYIFMTIRGLDGNIYINQGGLNPGGTDTWIGWQQA